jgi:2-haloacid dehalogenase
VITTIVFDLGGVLVDWNPRYLYRKLFNDPEKMETFLKTVAGPDWNSKMDAGYPFEKGVRDLVAKFPDHAEMIAVYHTRWSEMLGGEIQGSVEILKQLKGRYRLLALSNWSAETFPYARKRFEFLKDFESILISGEEQLIKPDPKFYQLLETRHLVTAKDAVFIDDVQKNIDAAVSLGFQTIRFESPTQLRNDLTALGISFSKSLYN